MTPPPRITYTTTRQEVLALGLEAAKHTEFVRRFRRHSWWVCALAWFCILLAAHWPLEQNGHFIANGRSIPDVVAAVSLTLIIGASLLLGWGTTHLLKHMGVGWLDGKLKRLPDTYFSAERWAEATEEQFILHLPDVEQRRPWSSVKELQTRGNHLALLGAKSQLLAAIPIRAFPSPEAQCEFEQYCRLRITQSNRPASGSPS